MDRRKFISKGLRFAAAGSLLGLSGYLLLKERPDDPQSCDFDFVCSACQKKKQCKLPEAVANRDNDQQM